MLLFFILAAISIGSAVMMISCRNPVSCVIWLILTLAAVAGLFLSLSAEFLAIIQILVYAGAIMVLFLFVIMMLNIRADARTTHSTPQVVAAVFLGLVLLYEVATIAKTGVAAPAKGSLPAQQVAALGNTEMVARSLFSDFLYPFEIVSILLLAAIVGAIVLAKREF